MAVCPSSFQGLPLSGGTITGNLVVTGSISGGGTPLLQKQAATPVAGVALINGTQNIISWTAPSDGQEHRAVVMGAQTVTSAETGGGVQVAYTAPGGGTGTPALFNSGLGAGTTVPANPLLLTVQAGSTVTVQQAAALTAGAATVWAEIWGS